MKLFYYADTDSLYIDLDDQGALVGIDIDHASSRLDLPRSGSGSVPFEAVGG
jgi:uncharacterized protein YuzE